MKQTILKLDKGIVATLLSGAIAIVANATYTFARSAVMLSAPSANHRGLGFATLPLALHTESATGVRILREVWNPLTPDPVTKSRENLLELCDLSFALCVRM